MVLELNPSQLLAQLAATPPRIAALTSDFSPEALQASPAPDEWSANDVLAHLRACADVWGNCIMKIIAEDQPTWRAVNPRTWIKQTDYPELAFRPSLQAFTMQRADLLAVLEPLPPACWSRSAIVTGVGRVLNPTVLSYAERMVCHERSHVRQIERIVNIFKQGV